MHADSIAYLLIFKTNLLATHSKQEVQDTYTGNKNGGKGNPSVQVTTGKNNVMDQFSSVAESTTLPN